ncbi:MAG: outer membrane beta-barrel protein, partial [Terracidiphilus sp.]
MAQVSPGASSGGNSKLSFGAGVDYWRGDWGQIARYGPAAWATDELWHGLGVTAEGYSMIAGGAHGAGEYKFFVGQGGVSYTYHWHRLAPYAKYELGFGSLSFPHKTTSTYTHDTRNTWAVGGGVEYKLWSRIWLRGDYTYEGFPDFYSDITHEHHTLDPAGFALGVTYHLR